MSESAKKQAWYTLNLRTGRYSVSYGTEPFICRTQDEQIADTLQQWDELITASDGGEGLEKRLRRTVRRAAKTRRGVPSTFQYEVSVLGKYVDDIAHDALCLMFNRMTEEWLKGHAARRKHMPIHSMSCFMYKACEYSILCFYKNNIKRPHVSFDELRADGIDLYNMIPSNDTPVDEQAINKYILSKVFELAKDETDREMLTGKYTGLTYRQISEALSCRISHVSLIKRFQVIQRRAQSLK